MPTAEGWLGDAGYRIQMLALVRADDRFTQSARSADERNGDQT
jgi:hypothetical protein